MESVLELTVAKVSFISIHSVGLRYWGRTCEHTKMLRWVLFLRIRLGPSYEGNPIFKRLGRGSRALHMTEILSRVTENTSVMKRTVSFMQISHFF